MKTNFIKWGFINTKCFIECYVLRIWNVYCSDILCVVLSINHNYKLGHILSKFVFVNLIISYRYA